MRGQDVPVVVDPTEVNHFPGSVEFESLQLQLLELFKHLCENKVCTSSFLALTSWCSPVDLRREGLCLFSNSNASARACRSVSPSSTKSFDRAATISSEVGMHNRATLRDKKTAAQDVPQPPFLNLHKLLVDFSWAQFNISRCCIWTSDDQQAGTR